MTEVAILSKYALNIEILIIIDDSWPQILMKVWNFHVCNKNK